MFINNGKYSQFKLLPTVVLLKLLLIKIIGFQFAPPTIQLSVLTINTAASYTFYITRKYDANLLNTSWNTQLVPAGSSFDIHFPAQYLTISDNVTPTTCSSIVINDQPVFGTFTTTTTGLPGSIVYSILGAINTSIAIQTAVLQIDGILNPTPAYSTGTFVIKLGNDYSANTTSGGNIALQPATFQQCSIGFSPSYVNTTSNMQLNVKLKNSIPKNGWLNVKFPASMQWFRQVSSNHQIPINGTLTCQLLSNLSFISSLGCNGSQSTQIVQILPAYSGSNTQISSTTLFSFSINNLFSPPTTQSIDSIQITSYSYNGYSIDRCTSVITGLIPKVMDVAYFSTVSPLYVNSNTGFRVNFTVADTISKTDYFQIQFPTSSQITYSFRLSSITLANATYISSNNTIIFTKSSSSTINFAGSKQYITFLIYKAPPSTRPTDNIRFVVKSSKGFEKAAGSGTISAVEKTYTSTLSLSNSTVSTNSNYTISFTLTDELTTSSVINLTIPSSISMNSCPRMSSSTTITSTPTCTFSNTSSSSYTITLSNINATSNPIAANQNVSIMFLNVINYFSSISVGNIVIKIYYTSNTIDLVAISSTNNVTLTPQFSYINNFSILSGSNKTLQKPVSYQIHIKLQSGMPVTRGLLILEIQSVVKMSSTINQSCSLAVIAPNSSTLLSSTGNVTVTASTSLSPHIVSIRLGANFSFLAGNTLILTLPTSLSIRNPSTTKPFVIRLSSYDSQTTPNLIDNGVSYTTSTVLQPTSLSSLSLSRGSSTNFAITNFQFVVNLTADLITSDYVSGSLLKLIIPSEIIVGTTAQCFNTATNPININCTINNNTILAHTDQTLTFVSSSPLSTFMFSFVISNIRNPVSFKPSSLFSITLQTSDSAPIYLYATDTTSLLVTNNISIQFPQISYNWSNNAYGSLQTIVNIGLSNLDTSTFYLTLNISAFTLSSSLSALTSGTYDYSGCTSPELISLICKLIIGSNISNKIIRISNLVGGVLSALPSTISISLPNLILTPPSKVTPNPYIIPIYGSDNLLYAMYSSESTIKFQPMCSLPCATCPSFAQPTVCLSCYTNANISTFKYLYNSSCYQQCPTNTFYNSSMVTSSYIYTCLICSTNCLECAVDGNYCLICYPNFYRYQHLQIDNTTNTTLNISQCITSCPNKTYATTITQNTTVIPSCLNCTSPCKDCILTNISCLTCLPSFYQFKNISIINNTYNIVECLTNCPIDVTVANISTLKCDYCVNPCKNCINITSNCTQCVTNYYKITNQILDSVSSTPSNLTLYGYSCLLQCPNKTLSIDGKICQLCTSPCLSCNNSLTSCLTCIANFYISSNAPYNTCVSTCQKYSFPNLTTLRCQLCSTISSLNCWDCISSTECNTCDDPTKPYYVYFPVNKSCLKTTPDGYVNISGVAFPCTNNCALCNVTTYNCTKCIGNFSLFFNESTQIGSCLLTCPSTYTSISNKCSMCLSPCLQCSVTLTNCTTCLSSFYSFNGACIHSYECPLYYYINQTKKACQLCSSPCSACLNSSFCLTCITGYLFQINGQCLTACPSGYAGSKTNKIINGTLIINASVCLQCLTPCLTCQNLRENCTSCIASYFYYREIYRCFQQCPSEITVPQTISIVNNITNTSSALNVCIQCQPPCRTCVLTTATCLTCIQNYYLQINQSKCVTQCAGGTYPYDGLCNLCVQPCSNCISATQCSSCVTGYYYYYELGTNNCLTSCPVHANIVPASSCLPCEQGCKNCSLSTQISSSECFLCINPYALYKKHCYLSCPNSLILYLNATQNKYYCLTSQQYALVQLGVNLSIDVDNILPLPFTIIAVFLFIATFMSRLQSRGTYIIGVLYCWFGLLQTGVLIYYLFGVYSKYDKSGQRPTQYQDSIFMLGIIGLAVIGGLNLLGFALQSCYLWDDHRFRQWATGKQQSDLQNSINKSYRIKGTKIGNSDINSDEQKGQSQCCSHKCTFITITIVALLTNYKLKVLLFTGLFKFTGLSFPMESVHKFRVFNIFSFFGMLNQGFLGYFIYSIAKQGISYSDNKLLFMQTIDVIIILSLNFILAILFVRKDQDFFESILMQQDYQELDDAKKQEQQRNQEYKKKKKQEQMKNRLYSLHKDFIGMDSYQSLKNRQDRSQQVIQVQQEDRPKTTKKAAKKDSSILPIVTTVQFYDHAGGIGKINKKYSKDQSDQVESESSNMGKVTKYESSVDHKLDDANNYRNSKVANVYWVQKQPKNNNIYAQDIQSEQEKTIINNRDKYNRFSYDKRNNVSNDMTNENAIKKSHLQERPPKYVSQTNNNVNYEQYGHSKNKYENILYKAKQSRQPQKNTFVQQHKQKINKTVERVRLLEVQNEVRANNQLQIKTQNRQQDKISNNKALIISKAPLSNEDISFIPVLPFVHQDGQLRYRQDSSSHYIGNKKSNKKDKVVARNIFEPQEQQYDLDEEFILDDINEVNNNYNDQVNTDSKKKQSSHNLNSDNNNKGQHTNQLNDAKKIAKYDMSQQKDKPNKIVNKVSNIQQLKVENININKRQPLKNDYLKISVTKGQNDSPLRQNKAQLQLQQKQKQKQLIENRQQIQQINLYKPQKEESTQKVQQQDDIKNINNLKDEFKSNLTNKDEKTRIIAGSLYRPKDKKDQVQQEINGDKSRKNNQSSKQKQKVDDQNIQQLIDSQNKLKYKDSHNQVFENGISNGKSNINDFKDNNSNKQSSKSKHNDASIENQKNDNNAIESKNYGTNDSKKEKKRSESIVGSNEEKVYVYRSKLKVRRTNSRQNSRNNIDQAVEYEQQNQQDVTKDIIAKEQQLLKLRHNSQHNKVRTDKRQSRKNLMHKLEEKDLGKHQQMAEIDDISSYSPTNKQVSSNINQQNGFVADAKEQQQKYEVDQSLQINQSQLQQIINLGKQKKPDQKQNQIQEKGEVNQMSQINRDRQDDQNNNQVNDLSRQDYQHELKKQIVEQNRQLFSKQNQQQQIKEESNNFFQKSAYKGQQKQYQANNNISNDKQKIVNITGQDHYKHQQKELQSIDYQKRNKSQTNQIKIDKRNMNSNDNGRVFNLQNLSINNSQNMTSNKLLEFDQSSLKRPRFEYQESEEKISNPFDGSIYEPSTQLLKEINQNNESEKEREDNVEDQQSIGNRCQILQKSRNDDAIPNPGLDRNRCNPITEANSEMQRSENETVARANIIDPNDHDQQYDAQYYLQQPDQILKNGDHNSRINHNTEKLLQIVKQANQKNNTKFKKHKRIIPSQEKNENLGIKLISHNTKKNGFESSNAQQSLVKKTNKKYPLKISQLKLQPHSEDEDEVQIDNIPSQRTNKYQQKNQKMFQVQSLGNFPQNVKQPTPKVEGSMRGYTKIEEQLKNAQSQVNLQRWKQKFIGSLKQNKNYEIQMQVPSKPIIDSQYEQSSKQKGPKQFDYEQTDRSYHRGKLFVFEETPHTFQKQSHGRSSFNMRQSKQKSKSKRSRYSKQKQKEQASPANSLQRIYLQKLSKK